MENTTTTKKQELINVCLKATERLKEKMIPFDAKLIELKNLKKACSELKVLINEYLSPRDKEYLYKYAWLEVVFIDRVPPTVTEFISLLEYASTPDVMGSVFTKRYFDYGITYALTYLYSELVGKVFPIPQRLAQYLANRIELATWNGVDVPTKRGILKLIEDSPKIYLVGSKKIEELVSFMTFVPVQK